VKALVVAAHGNGDESLANREITALTQKAARLLGVDEWTATFHRGTPRFASALDTVRAREVVVVPLMASAGYYCKKVLPKEIAKSPTFQSKSVRIAQPVGTSQRFGALATQRVTELLKIHGYTASETALMIVGHGTYRHRKSRVSTEELTRLLRERFDFKRVSSAFLDEDPRPDEVIERWHKAGIEQGIVLPFLIASGTHSLVDIPNSVKGFDGSLVVDRALGTLDRVADIIAHRALEDQPTTGGVR
jgi:sirohydrochlorin cobaltochelatase